MKRKQLPRLWCALQGLLPLEACLIAQQGELAWPAEPAVDGGTAKSGGRTTKVRKHVAEPQAAVDFRPRGAV